MMRKVHAGILVIGAILFVAIILLTVPGSGPQPQITPLPSRLQPVETARTAPVAPRSERSAAAWVGLLPGAPSDAPPCRLRVQTLDQMPVSRAEITMVCGTTSEVGETDPAGEWSWAPVDRFAATAFHVKAANHGARSIDLPLPVPDEFVITLSQNAAIEGDVFRYDGGVAPEGTRVFAWSAVSLSPAQFGQRQRLGAGLLVATTDSRGHFRIDGLTADQEYSLVAAAAGWVSTEQVRCSSTDHPRLRLQGIYGALVEAHLPDGSRPVASLSGSCQHWGPDDPTRTSLPYPCIELMAADLPTVQEVVRDGAADWRALCVAYAADIDAEVIHGHGVTYHIPGLERLSVEVPLTRLKSVWPVVVATVRPVALALGELRLELEPADIDTRQLDGYFGLRLELTPRSDRAAAFATPLFFTGRHCSVPGLPIGTYEARVVSPFGWVYPRTNRQQVEVGPNPVTWRVPGAEFGSVAIRVRNPDCNRRSDVLVVDVQGSTGRGEDRVYLPSPPYLLHGIAPGSYRLTLSTSGADPVDAASVNGVVVEAGKLTVVDAMLSTR